jgi:AraC family transcriptional regulator, transcriptional activator of pobA
MKFFKTINNLNEYFNIESRHPLIDIRRYSDIIPLIPKKIEHPVFGFYKISFIQNFDGFMQYGESKFNGTNGILYFVTLGQKYSCTSTKPWDGYQILIHPDIFKNHLTEKNIEAYNFFSYDVNESLLLTQEEENTISFLMNESWNELNNKNDDFSIPIILSYISILLNTSERFYLRQFNTRKKMCNQLASNFFKLLKTYYNDTVDPVLPSVFFFSEKLHVTPNYLSDVIRHYTGKSALNIIHEYIIEEAKILLKASSKSVSEISYMLGFEYPTYFSRLFKKKTNISPSEFRKSVKSI